MMMQRATSVPSCASHRALAAPSLGAVHALRPACSATKRSPTVATQAAVTVNGKTQQYVIKPDDVREVPVTGVQEMPEAQQAAIFFAIFGAIAAGTVAICTLTDMNWTQVGQRELPAELACSSHAPCKTSHGFDGPPFPCSPLPRPSSSESRSELPDSRTSGRACTRGSAR